MRTTCARWKALLSVALFSLCFPGAAAEPASIYGIHDHEPNPSEYLNHIVNGGTGPGWVTVAIRANTNDT